MGSSYTPGIIRTGQRNDFVLSVSVPVKSLAQSIPRRALTAWGILESEHFVLLITGFGRVYPVLQNDGTYNSTAQMASANLSFRVGLSPQYKPGKSQAIDAVGKDGAVVAERLDQLKLGALEEHGENQGAGVDTEREQSGQDAFGAFNLSGPLESLLNTAFLRVLRFRRSFGLGWAGADTLNRLLEDRQQTPEEALTESLEVCQRYTQLCDSNLPPSRL